MEQYVVEIVGLVVLALAALHGMPREQAPEPVPARVDDDRPSPESR